MFTNNRRMMTIALAAVVLATVACTCFGLPRIGNLVDFGDLEVGELQTFNESVELQGAESVETSITMGAGSLRVGSGADALMDAEFTYNVSEWRPEISYNVSGSAGELTIQQPSTEGEMPSLSGYDDLRYEWDVALSNAVPMDLVVNLGAGESTLDLRGMQLRSLQLNVGAGRSDIDLSGEWEQSVDVQVQGGVGSAVLRLPSNVGVRVSVQAGLGDIKTSGLTEQESGVYVNDAYGTADVMLDINVEAGIGDITLEVAE